MIASAGPQARFVSATGAAPAKVNQGRQRAMLPHYTLCEKIKLRKQRCRDFLDLRRKVMVPPSRNKPVTRYIRFAALAIAGLLLASCEAVVVETGPGPNPWPRPDRPQICPRIYQPVCATRHGRERTFPNACEARADGWFVRHPGQCRRHRPDRPPRPDRPAACPMIYNPVCGHYRGRFKVYSNACVMQSAGARRAPERYCRRG